MGNLTGSMQAWRSAPLADHNYFMDLVRYAKTLGASNRPTFFYSPVLGRIEAVHYSGRKTFSKQISPALFRQWENIGVIQVLGRSQQRTWNDGSTTSLVAFELREEVREDPAWGSREPVLHSMESWIRRVLPEGWRCPLEPGDAKDPNSP